MKVNISQPLSFHRQGGRDYQEDARFPNSDRIPASQLFFLVCDGVGGSDHGELASNTVCRAFAKKLAKTDFSQNFSNKEFSSVLDYAYDRLDRKGRHTQGDMATTLTFLCFHGCGCTMAHIGDSRIYQVRPSDGIVYKSDDHSLVNNMVHNGLITPDEAIDHPQGNMITRSMEPVEDNGNRSQATVVRTEDILPGDWFLLCSDGVSKYVDDDTLVEILANKETSNDQKINHLAELCKGSDDNNTAILIQVLSVDDGTPEATGNIDDDEPSTRRLTRYKTENMEIESIRQQQPKSIFSKLKTLFGGKSE